MADIYFYIDKNAVQDTLKYGMKLSQNFHAEVMIDNVLKKCMFGVLNPKDDLEKWNSSICTCIRAELKNDYLYVTDSIFINSAYFEQSLIPIEKYIFGTYKNPIVIALCSILPDELHAVSKYMDVPVLYDNSKDLYYDNTIEELKKYCKNSKEIIFNALINEYAKNNNVEKIELNNATIYKDQTLNRLFT